MGFRSTFKFLVLHHSNIYDKIFTCRLFDKVTYLADFILLTFLRTLLQYRKRKGSLDTCLHGLRNL